MQLAVTTMASRIGQCYLLCYDCRSGLDQIMIEIVSFFASAEKGGIRDLWHPDGNLKSKVHEATNYQSWTKALIR